MFKEQISTTSLRRSSRKRSCKPTTFLIFCLFSLDCNQSTCKRCQISIRLHFKTVDTSLPDSELKLKIWPWIKIKPDISFGQDWRVNWRVDWRMIEAHVNRLTNAFDQNDWPSWVSFRRVEFLRWQLTEREGFLNSVSKLIANYSKNPARLFLLKDLRICRESTYAQILEDLHPWNVTDSKKL